MCNKTFPIVNGWPMFNPIGCHIKYTDANKQVWLGEVYGIYYDNNFRLNIKHFNGIQWIFHPTITEVEFLERDYTTELGKLKVNDEFFTKKNKDLVWTIIAFVGDGVVCRKDCSNCFILFHEEDEVYKK